MVDRVSFTWDEAAGDGLGAIRLAINGRDLSEFVRSVEQPHAEAEGHPRIAGSYVGLRPWQLSGTPIEHFMGELGSNLACGPHDKTVLLGCECGEPGCWPLMAEVVVNEDDVIWRAFEQPHRRGQWSYDAMPELRFDRMQYGAVLAEAAATMPDAPASSH